MYQFWVWILLTIFSNYNESNSKCNHLANLNVNNHTHKEKEISKFECQIMKYQLWISLWRKWSKMKHEGLECVNNIWHIEVYENMMIFYYSMIHIKFPIFVKSLLVLKTIFFLKEKRKDVTNNLKWPEKK
jgi:hypothetical protein